MTQQRAGADDVHPRVDAEILVSEVDAGLGGSSGGGEGTATDTECRLMGYFSTVEHARYKEVLCFCQLTFEEGLIEGDAQVVADVEDAVGGLRLAHGTWFLHILHECHLIALACHLAGAVFTDRDDTEQIVAV